MAASIHSPWLVIIGVQSVNLIRGLNCLFCCCGSHFVLALFMKCTCFWTGNHLGEEKGGEIQSMKAARGVLLPPSSRWHLPYYHSFTVTLVVMGRLETQQYDHLVLFKEEVGGWLVGRLGFWKRRKRQICASTLWFILWPTMLTFLLMDFTSELSPYTEGGRKETNRERSVLEFTFMSRTYVHDC